MMMYRSKRKRRERNEVKIRRELVNKLFPGLLNKGESHGIDSPLKVKYLRLAVAVIIRAELDYLEKKKGENYHSAKMFLFGSDNLFTSVCKFLNINVGMARTKLLAFKKKGISGDPIFAPLYQEDSLERYKENRLPLSPTAEDIKNIMEDK